MKKILIIFLLIFYPSLTIGEIIIFKDCKNDDYTYEKNDYILDLNEKIMTREFIYSDESYKKLRLNDISIKKENSSFKGIIEENNLIISEVSGYPTFYTQLIFDKTNKSVKIKTVLNNNEGVSLISKCKKIIKYKKKV
jgi:hypothetical protein